MPARAVHPRSTDHVLETVRGTQDEARAAGLPWRERLRAVVARLPGGAGGRAGGRLGGAFVEVQAAGRSGLALRRAVIDRYVDLITTIAAELVEQHPDEVRPVPRELVVAAVGGINELILARVERGARPSWGRTPTSPPTSSSA